MRSIEKLSLKGLSLGLLFGATLLSTAFLTSCKDESDETLRLFLSPTYLVSTHQDDYLDVFKDALGVNVELTIPQDDYDKQLFTMLAAGERYDVIYLTQKNYDLFISQGALYDLTELIENSPLFSGDPELLEDVRDPLTIDGKIYAVPNKFDGGLLPTLRRDWLERWGMGVPTELQQWEAYWQRAKDEGRLGLSLSVLYDIQGWASYWGVKEGLVKTKQGTKVPYASDRAVEMWSWFADMYARGYIDPNFETNGSADFRNQFLAGEVASVGYWHHWIGTFNRFAWEKHGYTPETFYAIGTPPVLDENGNGILQFGDLSLIAIPANSANPDLGFAFLEWWNSEEGFKVGSIGFEGLDYTVDSSGNIELTPLGREHACSHGHPNSYSTRYSAANYTEECAALEEEEEAEQLVRQYGVSNYKPAGWIEVQEILEKYGVQAIKGSITPQAAVESMRRDVDALRIFDITWD